MTLTATKPATVNLGKSATLTLFAKAALPPPWSKPPPLVIWPSRLSSTKSIDIVGGVTRESTTFTYQVTPRSPTDSLCRTSPWLATGNAQRRHYPTCSI